MIGGESYPKYNKSNYHKLVEEDVPSAVLEKDAQI